MAADPPARARPLPYDLAFAEGAFDAVHFPAIQDEATRLDVDSTQPEQFLQLPSVGLILRTVLVEADTPDVEQFGPLLFHAYHFWRSGKKVYELDERVLRYLTAAELQLEAWTLATPVPAAYLRLPRHILWARIRADAVPEAVDGFFWSLAGARLDVLLVLGLIAGRPGFSVAPVSGDASEEPDGHWGNLRARETPPDFANVLPGGELERLLAIETTGEVLELVSRISWYVARYPERLRAVTSARTIVNWHG